MTRAGNEASPGVELRFPSGRRELSALWGKAPRSRAACVLAHGAVNDMRNRFLDGVVQGLTGREVSAMRFNFPFTEEGRRAPDRPPVLIEAWKAALQEAERRARALPLIAAGKSL